MKSMANMATERHIYGETAIKETTTETTTITEESDSAEDAKTVGKQDTGLLIVGWRKVKIKTMMSKTFLWEPHSVENFKKMTTKKITKYVRDTEVRHCTVYTTRKT